MTAAKLLPGGLDVGQQLAVALEQMRADFARARRASRRDLQARVQPPPDATPSNTVAARSHEF